MAMEENIQLRAYQLWEEAGRPHGNDQAFWFQAATEITRTAMTDVVKKPRTRKPAAAKAVEAAPVAAKPAAKRAVKVA